MGVFFGRRGSDPLLASLSFAIEERIAAPGARADLQVGGSVPQAGTASAGSVSVPGQAIRRHAPQSECGTKCGTGNIITC